MAFPAFNKKTLLWGSTEDGTDLVPVEDWIIDPVFEDAVFANSISPRFWIFNGNTISTPTIEEYNAIIRGENQQAVWEQIQTVRDGHQNGGAKVGDYWFHSDISSRVQFVSLLLIGANMPPIMWKTMSGEFVQMTPELAHQIFMAIVQKDIAVFGVAEQHRQQMMQLENPFEYDFSGSWPESYADSIASPSQQ